MRIALITLLASLALAAPASAQTIAPLGDPFTLAPDGHTGPATALNPTTGTTLLVTASGSELSARIVAADGTTGEPEAFALGYQPDVEPDPSTGGWLVAYMGLTESDGNEVFVVPVSPTGEVGTPEPVTADPDFPSNPAIARGDDPDCPWMVAWASKFDADPTGNIFTTRFDDAAEPCDDTPTAHTAFTTDGFAITPDLVWLPGPERFLLGYGAGPEDYGGSNTYMELIDRENVAAGLDDAHFYAGGSQRDVSIARTGDGTALVAVRVAQNMAMTEYGVRVLALAVPDSADDVEATGLTYVEPSDASTSTDRGFRPEITWNPVLETALVAFGFGYNDIPVTPEARDEIVYAQAVTALAEPVGEGFAVADIAEESDPHHVVAVSVRSARDWLVAFVDANAPGVRGRHVGLPPLPPDADADDDGVIDDLDCDDANPAIPGAEIAGNGVDEDCDGADAKVTPPPPPGGGTPAVTGATLSYRFSKRGRRTRVRRLRVAGAAGPIEIRCVKRRRCPKRLRGGRTVTPASSTVNLRPFVRKLLRPRLRITITLTEAGRLPRVYTIRTRAKGRPKVARS